ncbi:hypothetical protein DPEC_G00181710 [Dallia pectoralis]|uniref:Uncharacterized protein n=1 Tax=Dallia pectoralis TaxID=75939 RepID=A0ACC2GAQ2_DALPE|nr:hypothetical protein DPEC_G00181710 [Dallia pectoralis]
MPNHTVDCLKDCDICRSRVPSSVEPKGPKAEKTRQVDEQAAVFAVTCAGPRPDGVGNTSTLCSASPRSLKQEARHIRRQTTCVPVGLGQRRRGITGNLLGAPDEGIWRVTRQGLGRVPASHHRGDELRVEARCRSLNP